MNIKDAFKKLEENLIKKEKYWSERAEIIKEDKTTALAVSSIRRAVSETVSDLFQ
jgi:hypothetical protein